MTATELRELARSAFAAKNGESGMVAKACDLAADVLEPSEELMEQLAILGFDENQRGMQVGLKRARAILAALAARLEAQP